MPTPPASTPEPQLLQCIPTLEKEPPADSLRQEGIPLYLIITIALVLGAAVAGILTYLTLRRRRQAPPPTAEEIAYREVEELHAQAPTMRECCQGLSLILRRYLSGSTQDPALYETHEEFSQRMDSLSNVPLSCQLETRDLLEHLAEFKYAGETESNATRAHGLIEAARALVARIDTAQQQEQKNKQEVNA